MLHDDLISMAAKGSALCLSFGFLLVAGGLRADGGMMGGSGMMMPGMQGAMSGAAATSPTAIGAALRCPPILS